MIVEKKKFLAKLVLILLSVCLLPSILFSAIKIGYYDNYPLTFNDNGKPKGLFIDALRKSGILSSYDVEFIFGEFADLMQQLNKGYIDMVVCVAHTPEREKLYSFNKEPVLMNWGVLVSFKTLSDISELDGKAVAVNRGDIYYQKFLEIAQSFDVRPNYVGFDTYESVIKAVNDGIAIAGVVSRLSYLVNSSKYPRVRATSLVFSPVQLKFAIRRGSEIANKDVLEKIDKTIELMKSSGELDDLFNSYFRTQVNRTTLGLETYMIFIFAGIYITSILIFKNMLKVQKLRYKQALELNKQALAQQVIDEARGIYTYGIGTEILKKYIELSKRENHLLGVVCVEFEGKTCEQEKEKLEKILNEETKMGDFVIHVAGSTYAVVLYKYGVFFAEHFRRRIVDLITNEGLMCNVYVGFVKHNISGDSTAESLIYEAVAEMEKEKDFWKRVKE